MQRILNGTHVIAIKTLDEFNAFMDMCEAEGLVWVDDSKCCRESYTFTGSYLDPTFLGTVNYNWREPKLGIYVSRASVGDLDIIEMCDIAEGANQCTPCIPLDLASIF